MKTIHLVSVIDQSGSMSGVASRVINAYNTLLDQHANITEVEFLVTTVLFNTTVKFLDHKVKLKNATRLSNHLYRPSGGTALIDAIGQAVFEFGPDDKVLMFIDTDGEENSSYRYNKEAVKSLISARNESGWDITFTTADLSFADARRIASSLGVLENKTKAFSKSEDGYHARGGLLLASTMSYIK